MAEKDVTEKILESYNDVFADIVNVLLFGGRQVVAPDELEGRTRPRGHTIKRTAKSASWSVTSPSAGRRAASA